MWHLFVYLIAGFFDHDISNWMSQDDCQKIVTSNGVEGYAFLSDVYDQINFSAYQY